MTLDPATLSALAASAVTALVPLLEKLPPRASRSLANPPLAPCSRS